MQKQNPKYTVKVQSPTGNKEIDAPAWKTSRGNYRPIGEASPKNTRIQHRKFKVANVNAR